MDEQRTIKRSSVFHSIYRPLDEGKREVRFMRMIYDDDESSSINCELAIFSLDDHPAYKALSYCWTQADATCEIRLNGQPFLVRPNLSAYLEIMQSEKRYCWIFIDALCIHQNDINEKTSQVQLMGDVYWDATEVIAWLGLPSQKLDHTDSWLQDILNKDESLASLSSTQEEALLDFYSQEVARSPYWSRVWIVQELLLARTWTCRFGTLSFGQQGLQTLDCIESGIELSEIPHDRPEYEHTAYYASLWQTDDPWKQVLYNTALVRIVLRLRRACAPPPEQRRPLVGFADAILRFSHQGCAERYDKVYALLGLSGTRLKIDYSMQAEELFVRCLFAAILETLQHPANEASKEENPLTVGQTQRFLAALLQALNLPLSHPTVVLTTWVALHLCTISDTDFSLAGARQVARWPSDTGSRLRNQISWLGFRWRERIQLRVLAPLRLCYCRRRKRARLPACDGKRGRTYSGWVKMVEDVYEEVTGLELSRDDRFERDSS